MVGKIYRTLEQVVSQADPGGRFPWETPERKRASLPDSERMSSLPRPSESPLLKSAPCGVGPCNGWNPALAD